MSQAPLPLIALVTGCSGGIGLALARELKSRGYQVFATARQPGDLARLQAEGFAVFALDVNDQPANRCDGRTTYSAAWSAGFVGQ